MTLVECLALWLVFSAAYQWMAAVAATIRDRIEPPEDRETRLGIERSGREAAKGRHPLSGVRREVFDQETDLPLRPVIPPSPEVRDHGHGRSVAEAAAADPVRIQLDATYNLPAAQERRTT